MFVVSVLTVSLGSASLPAYAAEKAELNSSSSGLKVFASLLVGGWSVWPPPDHTDDKTVLKRRIPILSVTPFIWFLFTNDKILNEVDSNETIAIAEHKLSQYLTLSAKEQRDFLIVNQSAVLDLAPAFLSPDSLGHFVQSPGVQTLEHEQIIAMLVQKALNGMSFFGGLAHPRIVMEQEFFRCLTGESKRQVIFMASPGTFYLKKVYLISLDLARNVALWKLAFGKPIVALVLDEWTRRDQIDAFLHAFEQHTHYTQRFMRPVLEPLLLQHLPSATTRTFCPLATQGLLLSSVERAYNAMDPIIISTYGEGHLGLAKASLHVILLPIMFW